MSKKEKPYRIDFDVNSRTVIEIYEVSPDGSSVRTKNGWVSAYRTGIINIRPPHVPGFMTEDQIERAIMAERELLREKKYSHTAGYIVAQKYPIKKWLEGE